MGKALYQVMPLLAPQEYEALKADIATRGVQVPDDGQIAAATA